MTLHPEILVKDGPVAVLPYEEFISLKERLEDMEDCCNSAKRKRWKVEGHLGILAHVKRQLR